MILAYLDPGSGSLILQALVGGIAGVAVAFKAWKSRLIGRKATKAEEDTETPDENALGTES